MKKSLKVPHLEAECFQEVFFWTTRKPHIKKSLVFFSACHGSTFIFLQCLNVTSPWQTINLLRVVAGKSYLHCFHNIPVQCCSTIAVNIGPMMHSCHIWAQVEFKQDNRVYPTCCLLLLVQHFKTVRIFSSLNCPVFSIFLANHCNSLSLK